MTTTYQKRKEAPTFNQTPPQDITAERSVLGACLLNASAIEQAVEILGTQGEGVFFNDAHRLIFDAMVSLHKQSKPIDPVTLMGELSKTCTHEQYGGPIAIAELTRAVPTSTNIKFYAKQVAQTAQQRAIIVASTTLAAEAYSGTISAEELVARMQQEIAKIADSGSGLPDETLYEAAQRVLTTTEAMIADNRRYRGLMTGVGPLDEILGGLQPAEMVILAARPSTGKTAFALNVVQYIAMDLHRPVMVFTLEMSPDSLAMRCMQATDAVYTDRIRTGFLAKGEIPKMQQAVNRYKDQPIRIVDCPGATISQIRAKGKRFATQNAQNPGLFVIDYLQLMYGDTKATSREAAVAEISRGVKNLARETGWPVLCLSQLSREAEKDSEPKMSHLRESGAIEQDADVVIIMYRPDPSRDYYVAGAIKKNRNGPIGKVELYFDKAKQKFRDLNSPEQKQQDHGYQPPTKFDAQQAADSLEDELEF